MDRERDLELDTLLTLASRSALESLDAVIDVEQRLRDLYHDIADEPDASASNVVYDGSADHTAIWSGPSSPR